MTETAYVEDSREHSPVPTHFDAIIVAGMGPVALKVTKDGNLVARNVMNFLNAISAKMLVAKGASDLAILSGWKSGSGTDLESSTSEAALLDFTYKRAQPTRGGLTREAINRADKLTVLDEKAKTTFGNIIEGVNYLDDTSGGYWEGTLGVVSSEFHGPRIVEMIKMFGLNAKFLSAERIFRHFGYKGRLHPRGDSGFGNSWNVFEESVYKGQPGNLQNLLENPAYVTKELAAVKSDKRLFEIAHSLKQYIISHGGSIPDVFSGIPDRFNASADFNALRQEFAAVSIDKQPYKGDPEETIGYRELASYIADETDDILRAATL